MIAPVKLKPLVWHPHIAPVEMPDASSEQLEAMKVTPSAKQVSPYVRTLAHDPESYVARTVLFNAIMYADGGLPRPDRELGALGASVVNGCRYCAVIHGRQHAFLTKSDDVVTAIYLGQPETLSDRDAAIHAFARKLSVTPPTAAACDIAALRAAGITDAEILDLIHAIAIFGWANRLMHVLGHATPA